MKICAFVRPSVRHRRLQAEAFGATVNSNSFALKRSLIPHVDNCCCLSLFTALILRQEFALEMSFSLDAYVPVGTK